MSTTVFEISKTIGQDSQKICASLGVDRIHQDHYEGFNSFYNKTRKGIYICFDCWIHDIVIFSPFGYRRIWTKGLYDENKKINEYVKSSILKKIGNPKPLKAKKYVLYPISLWNGIKLRKPEIGPEFYESSSFKIYGVLRNQFKLVIDDIDNEEITKFYFGEQK